MLFTSRLLIMAVTGFLLTAEPPSQPSSHAFPPPWCLSSTDTAAVELLEYLRVLAASSDSTWITIRSSLDSMPAVSPENIALVVDETACQRASAALDSAFFTSPRMASVYLASVGSRYVAYVPGVYFGEWRALIHMDTSFNVLVRSGW